VIERLPVAALTESVFLSLSPLQEFSYQQRVVSPRSQDVIL